VAGKWKSKSEAIEKRENERRNAEKKKHTDEAAHRTLIN
jgi:hypothetical protein